MSLLGQVSNDLLISKQRLDYLIKSAPYRYKVYQIPKRSGRGMRTIAQPAREVKMLQYWVMRNVFTSLPIHPCAIGYAAGKNIRDNTEPHANNPYLLKLDFKDFFPSIKGADFFEYAKENQEPDLDDHDLSRLVSILFWTPKGQSGLQLSIGAPSSPCLSNVIMHRFDSEIDLFCRRGEVAYTRYADDMTFSMLDKGKRGLVYQRVREVLRSLPYPKLTINENKTIFGSKAHRRMVTGLILANNGSVSLGRERKRRIRAQIHRFSLGKVTDDERRILRGMLAFAQDIEPSFVSRMEQRYGTETITNILHTK